MRNTLPASLSLVCLAGQLIAQPTINFPADAPTPGTAYAVKYGPYQAPGGAGSNQTWNFSALLADSASIVNIVAPASAPGGAAFPNATAAIIAPDGNEFVQATSDGLFLLGTEFFGQAVPFTQPAQYLAYPCTFQTGWEGTYAGVVDVFGISLDLNGTVFGFADGYGTLQLPEATITDVLRVRRDDASVVESFLGNFELNNTSYLFYKPGFGIPIMEISLTVGDVFGAIELESLQWMDVTTVGLSEHLLTGIGVEIYPNPATITAQVVFNMAGGRAATVELFDAQGRMVQQQGMNVANSGTQLVTLDLQDLMPGMYVLRVLDDNGRMGSTRLVVH